MPEPWTIEELSVAPNQRLTARVYRGGHACRILHLHGGAFAGTLDDGAQVAQALAGAAATVVSVAYPCGRDHPFPEGLEAAYAALQTLAAERRRSPLLVAGEEAGGTIAAGLALMCRDRLGPKLAGQILLWPMLDPRLATCSVRSAGVGPAGCKWAEGWRDYLGTPDKACHPYAAPANAMRLAGLPRALIVNGKDDPTQDEAVAYAARLRASGVPVDEHRLGPDPAALRDALAAFLATHFAAHHS